MSEAKKKAKKKAKTKAKKTAKKKAKAKTKAKSSAKTVREKYLDALATFDDWVTVSEWTQHFSELNPELLDKANREAEKQANETTGLAQLAARIGAIVSTGGYEEKIEIDTSERPRKVRFIPEGKREEHEQQDIEDDIAPLRRNEIIRNAMESMGKQDSYRVTEFETITKQLKNFFGLDFEVDHARALLNKEKSGEHHPDNFQIILKAHNSKKNNNNWDRFSIEEQIEYIETAIKLQVLVAKRLKIEIVDEVLGSLIERLKKIY